MGKGRPCAHGAAKCANCGGPHGVRAGACTAKREAREASRGWRPPPPLRRERMAAEAPKAPEDEAPATQEGLVGGAEVGMGEEEGSDQAAMEMGE